MADTRVVQVTTAGGVDAELAADALWRAGAVAIEERAVAGGLVLVAATASAEVGPLVESVAARWPAEAVPVDLDAALDAWRPHARPVVAGRFLVRPPWTPRSRPRSWGPDNNFGGENDLRGRVEVVIDPGRAFGSGSHASTRLALEALGEVVAAGDRVLDVGCGSGVLAIAALLDQRAASAVGVDTDPEALAATRANAARNGVADRLTVAESVPEAGGFDLVVANMLAPTLIELAPAITGALRPGGHLVLAGLLSSQADAVLADYPPLVQPTSRRSDDWLAVSGALRS
jgi:ribosomal protein L11 methyltransferase